MTNDASTSWAGGERENEEMKMSDEGTKLDTRPAPAADSDKEVGGAVPREERPAAPEQGGARQAVDPGETTSRRAALLEADIAYSDRGWPTLPIYWPKRNTLDCACDNVDCSRIGKHPVYQLGLLEHGVEDATTDRQEVLRRRDLYPYANIAIATGAVSGLLVLDVDGDDGEASLAELEQEHGALPGTYEVATGRGRHLYFSLPEGVSIPSSVGRLGTDLDVRGEGGYVVAPPSRYQTGKLYVVTHDVQPAGLPGWLKQLLIGGPANGQEGRLGIDPSAVLAGIPEGTRDDTLFRYACRLRGQGLKQVEAEVLLREAAEAAKPPFPVEATLAKVSAIWKKYPAGSRGKGSGRGPSATDKLIEIVLRSELFHDDRKDTYAVSDDGRVRRILRVRGRELRRTLAHAYYVETGKGAGSEAINTAILVADAKAAQEGPAYRLDVRFAMKSDEEVWVDLVDSDWRAVRVTPAGWEIAERPPILFKRFAHMNPLPTPAADGDPLLLFDLLNLRNETDRILTLPWVVAAPIAEIPRPGLMLHGVKGSGKSSMAKLLRESIDPSATDGLDVPRDASEFAQLLDHTAVPWFDNISKFQDWQADRLCAAITGGGFSKRELYSDAEDVLMSFRRTMIVTGINIPTAAPDLLERLILVELSPPLVRLEEGDLWRRFRETHPRILGGLLDALSGAMRERSGTVLAQPPRMADFARWAAAAAEALGYGADSFERVYRESFQRQTEEVIASDPVAVAIRELVAEKGSWTGTASELLSALNDRNQGTGKSRDSDWPKRAAELGKRLRALTPTLREIGLTIEVNPSHTFGREFMITDPAALAAGVGL
jgi:hypothetical protein